MTAPQYVIDRLAAEHKLIQNALWLDYWLRRHSIILSWIAPAESLKAFFKSVDDYKKVQ